MAGVPSPPGARPWVAALVKRGASAFDGQFCGGTVVAPAAVVTAAHCVTDTAASDLDVVVGRTRLSSSGGRRTAVASIHINPGYDPDGAGDDVAVLRLADDPRVAALPLAGAGDRALEAPGARVTVLGWGRTGNSVDAYTDDLLEGGLVVRSGSTCLGAYGAGVFDSRIMVCAGGAAGGVPDACSGDSGGPLVSTGEAPKLVGIVSYGGERCGDPEAPGVYTRVSAEAAWIAEQAGAAPPAPAPPPGPAPAPAGSVRLRIGRIECGRRCRVEVAVSGADAAAVAAVNVRVLQRGRLDRVVRARRVGDGRWRASVPLLPLGKVRVAATALDRAGRAVGARGKVTISVVPA